MFAHLVVRNHFLAVSKAVLCSSKPGEKVPGGERATCKNIKELRRYYHPPLEHKSMHHAATEHLDHRPPSTFEVVCTVKFKALTLSPTLISWVVQVRRGWIRLQERRIESNFPLPWGNLQFKGSEGIRDITCPTTCLTPCPNLSITQRRTIGCGNCTTNGELNSE